MAQPNHNRYQNPKCESIVWIIISQNNCCWHCALCIVHCALCIVHCALCLVCVGVLPEDHPSHIPNSKCMENNTPSHAKCMSAAWQKQIDRLRLVMVTKLCLWLLLLVFHVDQGFELMVLLSCNILHPWCIVEELHGDILLNVTSFEHLTQKWFHKLSRPVT